jgi:hypothetical protein
MSFIPPVGAPWCVSKVGNALINQGAVLLIEQFREVAREATGAMLTELRRETVNAERASRIAVGIAWALGSASAIALAGVGGFLLAGSGIDECVVAVGHLECYERTP